MDEVHDFLRNDTSYESDDTRSRTCSEDITFDIKTGDPYLDVNTSKVNNDFLSLNLRQFALDLSTDTTETEISGRNGTKMESSLSCILSKKVSGIGFPDSDLYTTGTSETKHDIQSAQSTQNQLQNIQSNESISTLKCQLSLEKNNKQTIIPNEQKESFSSKKISSLDNSLTNKTNVKSSQETASVLKASSAQLQNVSSSLKNTLSDKTNMESSQEAALSVPKTSLSHLQIVSSSLKNTLSDRINMESSQETALSVPKTSVSHLQIVSSSLKYELSSKTNMESSQ